MALMRIWVLMAAALALLAAPPARAEVISASPSAFLVRAEAVTQASPEGAWRALGQIGDWWNSEHSFSGDAHNMRLEMRAGGCFCERWGRGQSVEHGRVVMAMEHEGVRTLRFIGGLGPLQELGAIGVMTFVVAPDPGGAKITMSFRAAGDAALGLDAFAPAVDSVLLEQFARLIRYANAGGAAR
jgi:hypothetical protein